MRSNDQNVLVPSGPVRAVFNGSGAADQLYDLAATPDVPEHLNLVAFESTIRLAALAALPIVVLPERRDFTKPLALTLPESGARVAEHLITADHLLPRLLHYTCAEHRGRGDVDAGKLNAVTTLAHNLLGLEIRVECHPAMKELLVDVGGDGPRRIQDLGSGVTEVLLLALTFVEYDRGLLLYEEPELHLHPDVQRRVLDELVRRCTEEPWQALVTTHSEHFLAARNREAVRYFEVSRSKNDAPGGRKSTITGTNGRDMLRRVIERLGTNANAVLGVPRVIWVEGPSDVIYLRHFLDVYRAIDTNKGPLIEDEHFMFACYGGALLKHLQLVESPTRGLVDLFQLNPGSYVVLDSDCSNRDKRDSQQLGKVYARRFMEDVSKNDAFKERVWVADGREIENYLPDHILSWAAYGRDDREIPKKLDRDFGRFGDQLVALVPNPKHPFSDKVKFARLAVERMESTSTRDSLARLDLKKQLERLVKFLRGK